MARKRSLSKSKSRLRRGGKKILKVTKASSLSKGTKKLGATIRKVTKIDVLGKGMKKMGATVIRKKKKAKVKKLPNRKRMV